MEPKVRYGPAMCDSQRGVDGALGSARWLARAGDAFSMVGKRGRTVASWLDLMRSTGVRPAWRRVRAERQQGGFTDHARDAVYREIWTDAAAATGAELADLSSGFFLLRRGDATTRVWRQVVSLDDPVTLRLALSKRLVHLLLGEAGVPVPKHLAFDFRKLDSGLDFLVSSPGPCVVKPADGTGGGDGATAGISAPADLVRARLHASRYSDELMIERQVEGAVYRLLFLDGELLDVVRSLPPHVVGDGRSTVERLMAAENERRLQAGGAAGISLLTVRLDTLLALRRQRLTLASVPAPGQAVEVQTVTNDAGPDDNETVHERMSPAVVDHARTAAQIVGVRLCGVDVITSDPTRPLRETGGAVTEVNGTPGLHRHYHVADRAGARRVAVPVLERLLAEAERAGAEAQRGGGSSRAAGAAS
jgi:D-alanine-D-alanine ligase-like ATP-grasp enzyme